MFFYNLQTMAYSKKTTENRPMGPNYLKNITILFNGYRVWLKWEWKKLFKQSEISVFILFYFYQVRGVQISNGIINIIEVFFFILEIASCEVNFKSGRIFYYTYQYCFV